MKIIRPKIIFAAVKYLLLFSFTLFHLLLTAQEVADTVSMSDELIISPENPEENQEEIVEEEAADTIFKATVILNDSVLPVFYTDTIIQWMTLAEAEAAQRLQPKKIFVDVFTTWCRWCRLSDSVVFRHQEISHFINQNFYPVRLNGEQKALIVFRGREYRYVENEDLHFHELTEYFLKGKFAYPGYVFLDEQAELVYTSNGYLTPAQLETTLHFLATDAYRDSEWTAYERRFVGRIRE